MSDSFCAHIYTFFKGFLLLMTLDDFPSEHFNTAAPVLALSDTRFFSVPLVNLWLLKFHASGSVVSVAAEYLLESWVSRRVSRG